ncbi:MAG: hypothetical protein K9K66_00125 [Desulfarculaceae bacterium]|nr:hypothetical protein [Desulfarculaceae bacterium]MCF8072117.1 hypothetical protein [Desulfarculaceae bacterium]MCF8100038.1 hypothetical protein [Desulfarculaceae bacterium]
MVLELITDFDGANLGGGSVRGNRVLAKVRRDPITRADGSTHDYNYHFIFGLRNLGDAPLSVEVCLECEGPDGLEQTPLVYATPALDQDFAPAVFPARGDGARRTWLQPTLPPHGELYLANTFPRRPEALLAGLDDLAAQGGARRGVYGQSLQGRDLTAYYYPAAQGPRQACVFITSGFHPPEPDTLASEAVMAWLASDQAAEARQKLSFCLAPVANPDGFFLGAQGHNAAGVNFYWEFQPKQEERIPEAAALWALAKRLQPSLYFDFHAYTFQGAAKQAGPYLKPLWFYRGDTVRGLAQDMETRLLELTGGGCMRGASPLARSTLQARLTTRYNTVTFAKYHLHLAQGVPACREHGCQVVSRCVQAMLDADLIRRDQVLARPWGAQPRDPLRKLRAVSEALWEGPVKGFLRPLLGR